MAFKVFRSGQEPAEEFGDKDRLEIIEGGVLKIRRQDGTNRYINPACWVSINETPPSTSSHRYTLRGMILTTAATS
jgi:hypothetical protein